MFLRYFEIVILYLLFYFKGYFMKNFQKRAAYFELENALDSQLNFVDKVQTVKHISNLVSEHLGYTDSEAEAYARAHIANVVRENEVLNMLSRIENDLINSDKNLNNEMLVADSAQLLSEIAERLKNAAG